jgi:hypothetical protein
MEEVRKVKEFHLPETEDTDQACRRPPLMSIDEGKKSWSIGWRQKEGVR